MNERTIDHPDTPETAVGIGDGITELPDNIIEKQRQHSAFQAWLNGENITHGGDFLNAVEVSVPNDFTQLDCGCARENPAQTPWVIARNAARPNIYHTACGSVIGEIGYCPIDI